MQYTVYLQTDMFRCFAQLLGARKYYYFRFRSPSCSAILKSTSRLSQLNMIDFNNQKQKVSSIGSGFYVPRTTVRSILPDCSLAPPTHGIYFRHAV